MILHPNLAFQFRYMFHITPFFDSSYYYIFYHTYGDLIQPKNRKTKHGTESFCTLNCAIVGRKRRSMRPLSDTKHDEFERRICCQKIRQRDPGDYAAES